MIVIGLILLLGVVAGAVIVVVTGGDQVRLHLHWFTLHTSGAVLFIAGVVAILLSIVAFWMLHAGLRRARRRSREIKDLRQRATASERARPSARAPSPPSRSTAPPPRRQDADDYFDSAPRD